MTQQLFPLSLVERGPGGEGRSASSVDDANAPLPVSTRAPSTGRPSPPAPSPQGRGGVAFFAALALVFSVATPAHAQPQTEAVQQHGVPVREITSPGGIHAWLVSDATVPMIVLSAYWKGGTAIDPAGLEGVTGVMSDMLTEGAGDMASEAYKERLQDLNMGLSFSADQDGIGMSLTTLSEHRDDAFAMARLALMNPRFDPEPLARIKSQIMVGIRTRDTNPGYISGLALDNALYPGHPYARRVSRASVTAITRATLAERRAALLTRDRLQITVVGDIDEATLDHLLDATFGALSEHGAVPPVVDAHLSPPTPLIVRQLPQPQSVIQFAAPGIQDEDPDWIPLAVANYILGGGGFSSRLMDQVREHRGLVYGISTSPSVRDHVALIRGSAQTENGKVREAIDVTRAEIARFYRDGATQTEVNDAITYLTGSFALELDSDVKLASRLSGYQIAGRPVDYVNHRNDLIRAVTLADVNRVIRRLFNPDNFTFVVVGQPEGLEPSQASTTSH